MFSAIAGAPLKRNFVRIAEGAASRCFMGLPALRNMCRYGSGSLRIVYYHVIADKEREYYFGRKAITPGIFREHLSFLCRHFNIVSLSNALQMADRGETLEKSLVLTFDDGFAENYNVIAPILAERHLPATFFLIGNCVDNRDLMWRNKLLVILKKAGRRMTALMEYAGKVFSLPPRKFHENIMDWSFRCWPMNKKDEIANFIWQSANIGSLAEYLDANRPYLSAKQIMELLGENFEIGSHSMSHPVFSRLSYEEFAREINGSAGFLERTFQTRINSFSYPFGISADREFEENLLANGQSYIKTFLGTKNRLSNYSDSTRWQRDNLEFPMNRMLFRLNILPLLRRLS